MKDEDKTKDQLVHELGDLRRHIAELENSEIRNKPVEDQIQHRNGFLHLILEALPHPFYVIDAFDYTISVANSAAQLGPLSEDTTCHDLTHKNDRPCASAGHPCPVEEIKKKRKPVSVEHIHYDKDGNPRNVEVHAFPIFDSEGNVSQIIESSIDITKRRLAEEALRAQTRRNETILQSAMDGFFLIDTEGKVLSANRAASIISGYSQEEMVGMHTREFEFRETPEEASERVETVIRKGFQRFETKMRRRDGTIVDLDVSTNFIDLGGEKFFFSFFRDVTKRKQAVQELKKREKELEIKTGNLEEVNTALTVLLKRRDEDKTDLEEKVLYNMKKLIEPYVEKLKKSGLDEKQEALLGILKSNLDDIISPFSRRLTSQFMQLTPAEIKVANLVRQGKTTKDIAGLLNLSSRTIESHRKNIRKKIGLKEKKANLRTRLLSIQ